MTEVRFRKLAVFGVGLIGGSFAAALKHVGRVDRVVGVGRGQANLARAVELGVIDEIAADARSAVADADLILVSVPVHATEQILNSLAPYLEAGAAITDGGSTKRDVIAAARSALGNKLSQFVPAHPIAGAEHSGVEAAHAKLYNDRTVVITPLAETAADARARIDAAWRACGARIVEMTPQRHDEVLAAVSHLPHALAFALVHMIASRTQAAELFSFAGAGFRDFTRIASSSPEMWRDIFLANRDALLAELSDYQNGLAKLMTQLQADDGAGLQRTFESARTARNAWLQSK
ncbi:MAG: prephenate dehydrogenase/arogenate dehydrogenase family protein [Betaproteobacteria bacterium]